jgi:signal transduction histidine kinase
MYLNYEYFTRYKRTSVLEIITKLHPAVEEFSKEILKSKNAFFTKTFKGKELIEWREYLKKTNQDTDPVLDTVDSVHYYFYSIGAGALGISSYAPLKEEHINLFKRFQNVFALAYKRFVDITLVTAQVREAKIEAALEKIRSRSQAMHKSYELQEVINTVFERLKDLGIEMDSASILIPRDNQRDVDFWIATPDQVYSTKVYVPYADFGVSKDLFDARNHGQDFFVKQYPFEEKNSWWHYAFEHTGFKEMPEERKRLVLETPHLSLSGAITKNISLFVTNFSEKILSGLNADVVKRIANVFEQAYIRFQDLQKAEAQAREAEIELALERVRSRAMAMHSSQELQEVATELRNQMSVLGQKDMEICAIHLYDESPDYFESNAAGPVFDPVLKIIQVQVQVKLPKHGIRIIEEMMNHYHSGTKDYVLVNQGEKGAEWFELLKEKVPAAYEFVIQNLNGNRLEDLIYYWSVSDFKGGALVMTTYAPPGDEARKLLRRFSNVFGLAYQRFKDLKKAEEQARESQIQLALERVRARTMAMHKSDELTEVAALLFLQVESLGIKTWTTGFNVWSDDNNFYTDYVTSSQGAVLEPYTIDSSRYEVFKKVSDAKKRGDDFYMNYEEGEMLKETYRQLSSFNNKAQFDKMLEDGFQFPQHQYEHFVFGAKVSLMFITYEPLPEAHDIFKRFGKVFEQTYTRFLDLQKAEAQARETQIQLALERVRAKTMAMQKSDELGQVVSVVFEQLLQLGFPSHGCAIEFYNKEDLSTEYWIAVPGNELIQSFTIPYFDHPYYKEELEAWQRGDSYRTFVYEGELKKSFEEFVLTHSPFANIPAEAIESFSTGERSVASIAFMNVGSLSVIGPDELSQDNASILQQFTKTFEQTYTRFLDLKKAEAQTREAQIQLALERVRARTMAMHESSELNETAELLFDQLKQLGAELQGVAFAICDTNSVMVQKWTSIGVFSVPYNIESGEQRMYEAWKNQAGIYEEVYEGERIKKYYELFMEIPAFKKGLQKFIDSGYPIPKWQKNHAITFKYGYLLLITTKPFNETQIFLRFGKVFEQTYTRFLDLQKAEAQAREAQIEAGLERVRARTMAMHKSEDLLDVIKVIAEQLIQLNLKFDNVSFGINNQSDDFRFWLYSLGQPHAFEIKVPYIDNPAPNRAIEAQKKDIRFFADILTPDENKQWIQHLINHDTFISSFPDKVKAYLLNSPGFARSTFILKDINLYIGNYSASPYTTEENNVIKRFAQVFEQSYTRFLDLQKAEAQAREAQIEASLERVRSKTMAMHNSNDVGETVATMFNELQKLGIEAMRCGIGIMQDDYRMEAWTARSDADGKAGLVVGRLNMKMHPLLEGAYNGWKLKSESFSYDLYNEDLLNYYTVINNDPGYPIKYDIASLPSEIHHNDFYFPEGSLYVFSKERLPDETKKIFKRFAAVFGQTYRRYLDLQKAEAQARESQIQLALERVRARTMAMHSSTEFAEVAALLFEQVKHLGIETYASGFNIWDNEHKNLVSWMSNPAGGLNPPFEMPIHSYDQHERIYQSWKNHESFKEDDLIGDALIKHYQFLRSFPLLDAAFSRSEQAGIKTPDRQVHNNAYFSNGYLLFITLQPCPEAHDIFKRFAKVFEQTYIRFLDLQKAEAQAREAQIEASLERVRSKAMAMHNSQDLADTIGVFYKELQSFSFTPIRCGVGLLNKENKEGELYTWNTTEQGESLELVGKIKMEGHIVLENVYNGWLSQTEYHPVLRGNEIKEYYKVIRPMMAFPDYEHDTVQYGYFFFFKEGGVYAWTEKEMKEDELQIYRRFTSVLSLTYKRYKDLQLAEANAREAKIEAAMEKVRARAMAMQKTNELIEVAELLRKEMGLLGVEELETSSIYIHDEASGTTECWYAIQDIRENEKKLVADYMIINLSDTWVGRKMLSFYKSGQKQISIVMKGKNRKEWIDYCADRSKILKGYYGEVIPERTYHLLKFSNGYIGAASPGEISKESWDLLKRATSVFSLAYTRFSDLQIAEASAKEAIKQAALDRIRADIASMRTISDLDRITPLIWNELNILGIPFIRCGVFIMDESQKLIHTFLSTPDGKAIAAFHLPYDTPGNLSKVLSHWKDHNSYIDHWDQSAFTEMADILVKQGAIISPGQYLDSIPHGGFYLHFLPFLQGMLYVGNTSQLGDDDIELIQHIADAFSTAYARYEDFNKLETAKQQVEKTLVDLKQAQQQLVQSEKMASLGELTAGIAHEIQNPLNFVNNFSDVSNELIDEMKEELAKGNIDDAMAIAEDVKQNLEKINHHGKRADGIVKGMLQHSRVSAGQKEMTDINMLADEYLRLAYHGLRAKDKSFNAKFETDFDDTIDKINIIPQDIGRVILNLINNAFYAVTEKRKENLEGFEPTVTVTTAKLNGNIEIRVKDNGIGIQQKVLDKIFQPFFTTKPTGQGTGLGLSLAYDIVSKGHGGELKVETKKGEGSEFIILLPV